MFGRKSWQDHPACKLRVGMTRTRMIELLGEPTKTTSMSAILGGYASVTGSARAISDMESREYVLYESTPPGHATLVGLQSDTITSARIERPGTPIKVVWEIGES